MSLSPEDAHTLAIAGATQLELANDDDLWRDFMALVDRAGPLAEANALNRDAADRGIPTSRGQG